MRKAIDWLLLALGVVLFAVGFWWMWAGWDIVQVERGWAAVIAGSVLLTGGVVTTAIAWAVMSLRGKVVVTASAPDREAPGPGADLIEPAQAPEVAGGEPPGVTAAPDLEIDEATLVAVETFGVEESDSREDAEPSAKRPSIDDLLHANSPAPIAHRDEAHDAEPGQDAPPEPARPRREPFFRLSRRHAPTPPVESEPPAKLAHEEQDDWLDQTALTLDAAMEQAAEAPASSSPFAEDTLEPPVQPSAEPSKAAAVVGRYSSGDTNYIMFNDGSIEAQTPDGVMRFSSLVELRRFVEQRK